MARTVTEQLGCVPTVCGDDDLVARGAVLALSAPTAGADVVAPTTSGPAAIPSRGAAAEADAPDSAEQLSADDAEAPTVVLAVPAVVDAPTTRCSSRPPWRLPTRHLGSRRHLTARGPEGKPLPSSMPAAAAPHGAAWPGRSSAWER